MQLSESSQIKSVSTPAHFLPLDTIAVAISGGGFRAAAFGLGCLYYLNRCKLPKGDDLAITLLDRVQFMSSASGGSFASLLYAKFLYEGKPFSEMYTRLRNFMDGETLLKRAMDLLGDDRQWHSANHHKQRNLINAFSLVYDELFDHATLALLCDPNRTTTLNQICINATEFQNGISFRFQNIDGKNRQGLVGNFGMYMRPNQLETIRRLKLGDIMAASSCFPAGMEPIIYPRDFAYKGLSQEKLREAILNRDTIKEVAELVAEESPIIQSVSDTRMTTEAEVANDSANSVRGQVVEPVPPNDFSFGLMDGGIDDNQAIKSLMLAEERFRKSTGNGYDTFIVCDVNTRYISSYKLPDAPKGGLNPYSIRALAAGLGLLLIVVATLAYFTLQVPTWRIGTIGGCLSLLLLEVGLLIWAWRSINSAGGGTWGLVWKQYKGYFFTIPLGSLRQMLVARIDSVVILAGDIMMKQIRRLIFEQFYDNEAWKNRRITTLLGALSKKSLPLTTVRTKRATGHKGTEPSPAMQKIADEASQMDTTLWFNGKDIEGKINTRDKLIATGQFTMCYNLLRYLDQMKKVDIPKDHRIHLDELEKQLQSDWEKLQKDPLQFV
jgi:hypothetical protein